MKSYYQKSAPTAQPNPYCKRIESGHLKGNICVSSLSVCARACACERNLSCENEGMRNGRGAGRGGRSARWSKWTRSLISLCTQAYRLSLTTHTHTHRHTYTHKHTHSHAHWVQLHCSSSSWLLSFKFDGAVLQSVFTPIVLF